MSKVVDKLIHKLESLDEQDRIDLVAEDIRSGANKFRKIDAWKLSELLGIPLEDAGDGSWRHSHWGYKKDIDDCGEFPFAANIELLEGEIPKKRFQLLVDRASDILDNDGPRDLKLNKKEESLLREAYSDNNINDTDLALCIASNSVTSSTGEKLRFVVCIGDGGEPFDALSPYDLADGASIDTSDYIRIE